MPGPLCAAENAAVEGLEAQPKLRPGGDSTPAFLRAINLFWEQLMPEARAMPEYAVANLLWHDILFERRHELLKWYAATSRRTRTTVRHDGCSETAHRRGRAGRTQHHQGVRGGHHDAQLGKL